MKRYWSLITSLFLASLFYACTVEKPFEADLNIDDSDVEYVNASEAAQIAQEFLSSNCGEVATRSLNLDLAYTAEDSSSLIPGKTRGAADCYAPFYHVFTLGETGFIIVAGDEAAKAVLGYSLTNKFDVSDIPANMETMLRFYSSEISWRRQNGVKITEEMRESRKAEINGTLVTRASGSVSPLLGEIEWNQDPYYNDYCPSGTPVGCVATATSQIMRYWEYPSRGQGSYTSTVKYNGKTLSFNYDYDLNWSNMPKATLTSANSDIAKFCYGVGVGVNMQYTSSGSGAYQYDVPRLLTENYKYPDTIKRYVRETSHGNYNYTTAEWEALLKTELDAGRPVQYAGFYYNGYSYSGGHSFVCDGYNSSGYFHFNWGWGGVSNGYFVTDGLQPSALGTGAGAGNFNALQEILTGIQAPEGGDSGNDGGDDSGEVTYPGSKGNNNSYEWISNFSMGSFSNSSSAEAGGYAYYSDKKISLNAGESVSVSVTPNSSSYTEYCKVWVDYNKDGKFADSECVLSSAGKGKRSGTFTVPSDTTNGYVRVRVALKYGSYPSSNETFSYGEVEDYDLKVVASGSQPDPDPDPNPDPNPDPEPDPDVDNYDSLTYPESYSKNYSYMYIKSVTIGNMTNASSGSTYTYYPDKQVNASSGATLSVSFTPGFSYYRYYTYWQMWLDSDKDGAFSSSERLAYGRKSSTISGSIKLPSLNNGKYRIRVTMSYGSYVNPDAVFNYGEVEDYVLVIQ